MRLIKVVLLFVIFTSCDTQLSLNNDFLTKRWFLDKVVQLDTGIELPVNECNYIEFYDDNSYISHGLIKGKGKWSVRDEYIECEGRKLKIINLSNNELSMELDGNYYYFSLKCKIEP